jgi:Mn2+/Fe2+ NRAMP family transporter
MAEKDSASKEEKGGETVSARELATLPPNKSVEEDLERDEIQVRGALGTLRERHLADRRPREVSKLRRWTLRIFAFLVIMGPGIIVMVGDNDAGGVTTYAQAGQAFGYSLLWLFPLLLVVLYVAQEMVGRLGAVTGVGHGKLLRERFGRFWAAFSVFDLFLLNFLTLLTEFIGIDLGFRYFGVPNYISVPAMAVALIAIVMGRQFYRWERLVFIMVGISMLMLALPFITGSGRAPAWGRVVHDLVIPGVHGGLSTTAMIFIIGIVGTTIAPWQLFFQQGSVVDKRISTRFTNYERADTFVGSIFTNLQGAALVIVGAMAFIGTKMFGGQSSALHIANGFAHFVTPALGTAFAIVLLNAAMIGAATVTLASSYAIGDLFGVNASLNSRPREAKGFYISYAISVVAAGGIVLVPHLPLGLVNLGVQVLAGILLPSALGFLVLLCNDKELMGPWANSPWVNVIATLIVALLLQLSLVLTIGTIWTSVNITLVTAITGIPVLLATVIVGISQRLKAGRWRADPVDLALRKDWITPPDVLTRQLPHSRGRNFVLGTMRVYLVVAMILMVVSFVSLAH